MSLLMLTMSELGIIDPSETLLQVSVTLLLGIVVWLSMYFSQSLQRHRRTSPNAPAFAYITDMNIPFYKASYKSKWEHTEKLHGEGYDVYSYYHRKSKELYNEDVN